MNKSQEFKSKLDVLRTTVINTLKSTARMFETYEVACEIEKPIAYAQGYDDQDEPQMPAFVDLDGTIEIYHQGCEVAKVQPEACETEFLIELLGAMEELLEELRNENLA